MLSRNIFLLILAGSLFVSCSKDDLAFDIIESPVLAQFEALDATEPGMLKVKATFFDLDKTGILDNTVGIDSLPVSGLAIKVYVFELVKSPFTLYGLLAGTRAMASEGHF